MPNTIKASLEFSFKGETHTLTSVLDLDQLLAHHDEFPFLYALLARDHHIDSYSYEYEVIQEEEILFSEPQGFALDYVRDDEFDIHALMEDWQTLRILSLLRPIALRELDIADLNQHEKLKNTLIQVYSLGLNCRK